MITVLIADDETPAREELKYLLEKFSDLKLIGEASDGMMALDFCTTKNPDVVMLDIQMPGLNGLEVARNLLSLDHPPYIIFVTAYDSYAVDAFELHAVDYLLKPLEDSRLSQTIDRVRKVIESQKQVQDTLIKIKNMLQSNYQQQDSYVTVSSQERYYPIHFDRIKYAYAEDKETYIITDKGKFAYKNTLTHLEEIAPIYFCRIHRSYMVNIHYITLIDSWFNSTYRITLPGVSETLPVSRSHVKKFKELMKLD
ncbi:MAG: LytTR family transcriptional regulator DNA-binding domain-containing protein [Spirochaetes bacterium]|nr:LytTR family transcriptional regulator DNA-binding domain-containing protein [Spirochaetota bacterium]